MVPKGSTTPAGAENLPPLASARRASSAQAAALAPEVLALASASFSSLGFFACMMYIQSHFFWPHTIALFCMWDSMLRLVNADIKTQTTEATCYMFKI